MLAHLCCLTMTDQYYTSSNTYQDDAQFESLVGNTRQRRIGGNTPYRDDPVSKVRWEIDACIDAYCCVWFFLIYYYSLFSFYIPLIYRMLLHHHFHYSNNKMVETIMPKKTPSLYTNVVWTHARHYVTRHTSLRIRKNIIQTTLMMRAGAVVSELLLTMEFGWIIVIKREPSWHVLCGYCSVRSLILCFW